MQFRTCGLVAVTAALSLPLATPAAADTLSPYRVASNISTTQAGYLVAATVQNTTEIASFTVPKVTCQAATASAMEIGAITFWYQNPGVYPPAGAGVLVNCPGGGSSTPTLKAAYLLGPVIQLAGFRVKPGDAITSSVAWQYTRATLTITDNTTGKTNSRSSGFYCCVQYVLWGVDTIVSSGTTEPIPKFSTFSFANSSVNGQSVKASNATPYDLAIGGTNVDIHTGALDSTGGAWKEFWKANS